MIINGAETDQYDLTYDRIIKDILAQSDEMTIRLMNGLFDDNIPLDAPVVWLDKESIDSKYSGIVADFYPRIGGKMYAIEIEQDGNGDMAVRVFRYAVGGAMFHNMKSTKAKLNIAFPQPCVAMLNTQHRPGTDYNQIIKDMKNLGISDEAIEAARKQYEAELDQ